MNRPRIVDPHAIAVRGDFSHLPSVAPAALTADALRRRFADPPPWQPEFPGDGVTWPDAPRSDAAVLVPLVVHADGVSVLLTRRTTHLRAHAGQISFPGGRSEPQDAGPEATALREAGEEVGLDPGRVSVIGRMPVYTTVTHFVVTPVVALVEPPLALTPDPFEVAEAFEVPLAFLMDPAHHRQHEWLYDGGSRRFLSMPWIGRGADGVEREYFIWGATAAMLHNLYRFLAA